MNPAFVVPIAFGASLLGALSGGSSSMITIPAWVALGSSFPVAVAADKVAGMFWTLAAARAYLIHRTIDRSLLVMMGLAGLAGAATGAWVATTLDERVLRRGAAALILGALLLSLRRPPEAATPSALGRGYAAAAAFPLGVYEGLLGSGNSILTSLLLQRTRGWDLLLALGHYYALAAMWCALAAAVYVARGAFDPRLTLYASVGSVMGGSLGARLGRSQGSALVRPLFVIAGLVLALRLLFS